MIGVTVTTLPADTNTMRTFTQWLAGCCTLDACVLDIGAGYDRNRVDAAVRPLVSRLVGIDPSEGVLNNSALHERHQVGVEEFVRRDDRRFDVVFTAWVLEHVDDPPVFFAACRHLLKPGGALLAITPNLWHYFGLTTKVASTLGLEDWLLARIIGVEHRTEYHFPTRYRANSIHAITRALDKAGFDAVEFRCCDAPVDYDYIVPQPLRWVPRLYSNVVYRLKLPWCMGRIMFCASVSS